MKKAMTMLLALLAAGSMAVSGLAEEEGTEAGNETEELVPVYADDVKDGTYSVDVLSDSSLFEITDCQLTAAEGKMTAVITLDGSDYEKLFMGTGRGAVSAKEEACIPLVAGEDGEQMCEVPVEALDMKIHCAAWSGNEEQWDDDVLVFLSDSLPQDALGGTPVVTAEELGLEDGTYLIDVRLEGGSGKASVESPAPLTVEDGQATAVITFSSPHYDYMLVNDEKYERVNTEGNSSFEIPVSGFDGEMPVTADTLAMSVPHEIDYTLYFDSASIIPAE